MGMQLAWLSSLHKTGSNATMSASIPKSLLPFFIRKSPFMPQPFEYEFRMIQYFVPVSGSTPHPIINTEWFWFYQERP